MSSGEFDYFHQPHGHNSTHPELETLESRILEEGLRIQMDIGRALMESAPILEEIEKIPPGAVLSLTTREPHGEQVTRFHKTPQREQEGQSPTWCLLDEEGGRGRLVVPIGAFVEDGMLYDCGNVRQGIPFAYHNAMQFRSTEDVWALSLNPLPRPERLRPEDLAGVVLQGLVVTGDNGLPYWRLPTEEVVLGPVLAQEWRVKGGGMCGKPLQ